MPRERGSILEGHAAGRKRGRASSSSFAATGSLVHCSPMKSTATTVKDYLASLPEEGGRRACIEAVRKVILANLDKDYEECMLWGVAAYVVPQRVWPAGHHTDPKKPLMMCGVSSQKNDMVVYMMNVFGGGGGLGGDKSLREWFEQAWVKAGKKLGMCVDGAGGCCIRFRKLEDIALDVIGEAIRRTPAKVYVENYVKALSSRGHGSDGKNLKGAGGDKAAKKSAKTTATKPPPKTAKKIAKKVAKKNAKR